MKCNTWALVVNFTSSRCLRRHVIKNPTHKQIHLISYDILWHILRYIMTSHILQYLIFPVGVMRSSILSVCFWYDKLLCAELGRLCRSESRCDNLCGVFSWCPFGRLVWNSTHEARKTKWFVVIVVFFVRKLCSWYGGSHRIDWQILPSLSSECSSLRPGLLQVSLAKTENIIGGI